MYLIFGLQSVHLGCNMYLVLGLHYVPGTWVEIWNWYLGCNMYLVLGLQYVPST